MNKIDAMVEEVLKVLTESTLTPDQAGTSTRNGPYVSAGANGPHPVDAQKFKGKLPDEEEKKHDSLAEAPRVSKSAQRAKEFLLVLPKFTPTEAWGDPNSIERRQIDRIFKFVGGSATPQAKLKFIQDTITSPARGGNVQSVSRIMGTLILLESLNAVIRSFNEASAGFVFEGFLSALFRGRQEAERSEKGNLPIQDLVAFSELPGSKNVPISLKLLGAGTDVEGSYTNLVDALFDDYDRMMYIVARKDGDEMALEQFEFTRENFIDAISQTSQGKLKTSAELFKLPGKTVEQSIKIIKSEAHEAKRYELLQQTSGYRASGAPRDKKDKTKFDNYKRALQNPALWSEEKWDEFAKQAVPPEIFNLWASASFDKYSKDGLNDFFRFASAWKSKNKKALRKLGLEVAERYDVEEEDIPSFLDALEVADLRDAMSMLALNENKPYTVEENNRKWNEQQHLLTESGSGGRQWNISAAQLPGIQGIDYQVLGTLPYSNANVMRIAESYMDLLGEDLENILLTIKNLSEKTNQYFLEEKRAAAIPLGEQAAGLATDASEALSQRAAEEAKSTDSE